MADTKTAFEMGFREGSNQDAPRRNPYCRGTECWHAYEAGFDAGELELWKVTEPAIYRDIVANILSDVDLYGG